MVANRYNGHAHGGRTGNMGKIGFLPNRKPHKRFPDGAREWLVALHKERPDLTTGELCRKFFREFNMDVSRSTVEKWKKGQQ